MDSPMQPLYEYVCHMKGHRNSDGELAEWVIKSHETGEILSSHKSEKKAKEHLQQMHIFNESVDGASYPKLYHICGYMTGLTDDDIRDILTNGLRLHDNGEANCIWFSTGKTFIEDIVKAPLIVSLECTPENIKKYRIDEYEVRNQSGAINVHENVPMEDLNIEQLMWGRTHHGEGTRIYPLTSTKYYGNFERWQRFDKDVQAIIYEDLFNMWARDDIARQGFNPDLNRLKEIMGDRLTITNFMKPKSDSDSYVCDHCGWDGDGVEEYNGRLLCPYCLKEFQRLDACRDANGYVKYDNITKRSDGFNPEGYKLIGESNDGNNMDKRVQMFMEGVSQLGLSKNQVDAIGKITNACMESDMFGNTEDDGNDNPENNYNPENDNYNPENDNPENDYNPENDNYNPENDNPENDYNPENDETPGEDRSEYAHELTMDEMYDKLIEQGISKETINIVTDIIGWNPDSMLKILDAATGYKSFDQLPEF